MNIRTSFMRRFVPSFCLMGLVCGYGAAVLTHGSLQAFVAVWIVAFVALFVGLLRCELNGSQPESLSVLDPLLLIVGFYLMLLVGLAIGGGWSSLWTLDSKQLHLPGIEKTLSFFRGEAALEVGSVFGGQVQLTYLWTAIWFSIFGSSEVVSALAMLVLRIAAWVIAYDITRSLFGLRVARIALLLTAFVPTQIFYAMLLMKDPAVQLLTTLCFWSLLRIFQRGQLRYLILGLFAIACLALERFYIVPTFAVSFALAVILCPVKDGRVLRLSVFSVGLVIVLGLFWKLFKRDFNIQILRENLEWVRAGFQGGAEVDKAWNMDISYPLAFVKILFTPFFRLNKFSFFTDLSALLTWGSFVSQAVMAIGLYGIFKQVRIHAVRTLIVVLPILFFLLVFAYLAPFSGRQRDGYFPMIAMFAAYAIERMSRRGKEGSS